MIDFKEKWEMGEITTQSKVDGVRGKGWDQYLLLKHSHKEGAKGQIEVTLPTGKQRAMPNSEE